MHRIQSIEYNALNTKPFLVNGRRPPFVESGRRPYFLYSEDDHTLLEWKMTGFVKTGRRPHLFFKWNTTSIAFLYGRQPKF